jgi:hypothetical protein
MTGRFAPIPDSCTATGDRDAVRPLRIDGDFDILAEF